MKIIFFIICLTLSITIIKSSSLPPTSTSSSSSSSTNNNDDSVKHIDAVNNDGSIGLESQKQLQLDQQDEFDLLPDCSNFDEIYNSADDDVTYNNNYGTDDTNSKSTLSGNNKNVELIRKKRTFFGRKFGFKGLHRCRPYYYGHYRGHLSPCYHDNDNDCYHSPHYPSSSSEHYNHESSLLPQYDKELEHHDSKTSYDDDKQHNGPSGLYGNKQNYDNKFGLYGKYGKFLKGIKRPGHGYGYGYGSHKNEYKPYECNKCENAKKSENLKNDYDVNNYSKKDDGDDDENKTKKKAYAEEIKVDKNEDDDNDDDNDSSEENNKKPELLKGPVYYPKALFYVPSIPVPTPPLLQPCQYSNQYPSTVSSNYQSQLLSPTPITYTQPLVYPAAEHYNLPQPIPLQPPPISNCYQNTISNNPIPSLYTPPNSVNPLDLSYSSYSQSPVLQY